jgi:hypothetical protein
MAANITSAAVLFRSAQAGLAAASVVAFFLAPAVSLAATPRARTSAITPLEEGLVSTPGQRETESRQPVLGYLRHTPNGWKLDMLPGAVARTGPLPVLTQAADAPREDATSATAYPYAPLLRIDF